MILLLEAIILLGILLYLYLTWHHNHWQKLGVAGDRPSVLFGSFSKSLLLRCHRGEEIDALYTKFPNEKVIGAYNFRKPALIIRDPELVHKILVTDFHSFRNNDIDINLINEEDPITKNIFFLKDEEWKRNRAFMTPAFTVNKIKSIFPQMIMVAEDFVQYLKQHPEELNIKNVMSRYTTEIIAKCAVGIESFAFKEDKSKMYEVGKSVFESTFMNHVFNFLMLMPELNKILNFRVIPKNVSKFFNSILSDVILYRQKNNVQRNDLIQYLIDLKKKSLEVEKGNVKSELITKAFTDNDILSYFIMFFIEAYETSALVLTNILYYLALNKNNQEKLRGEIDAEMEKGELSYEGINNMHYLNCVFQETNRIAPVMHFLFKKCTERYEFDLGNKKSVPVEKGTSILIPVYGLQTDPKYWNDALEFRPERFSNEEGTQMSKLKSIYMPFGEGPRMCIGIRIASTIIKVGLIHILSKFEVLPVESTPKKIEYDPKNLIMVHKGGIYLRFAERSKS